MIFAIDMTNWTHVLHHALRGDRDGVLQAMISRLDAINRTWTVTRLVAAFDRSPTFRHELFADYKAGRERHDGVPETLAAVEQLCRDRPDCITIAEDGFEADDVLATVARLACESGHKCVLATPDKDCAQLLRQGRVTMLKAWKLRGGKIDPEWMTAAKLRQNCGVIPQQWIDYQCLVGDRGDNIEGVPGIGPKTATTLLQKHTTVASMLANPWELSVSDRVRGSLIEFSRRYPLVRRLVALETRVPWVIDALDLEPTAEVKVK